MEHAGYSFWISNCKKAYVYKNQSFFLFKKNEPNTYALSNTNKTPPNKYFRLFILDVFKLMTDIETFCVLNWMIS